MNASDKATEAEVTRLNNARTRAIENAKMRGNENHIAAISAIYSREIIAVTHGVTVK